MLHKIREMGKRGLKTLLKKGHKDIIMYLLVISKYLRMGFKKAITGGTAVCEKTWKMTSKLRNKRYSDVVNKIGDDMDKTVEKIIEVGEASAGYRDELQRLCHYYMGCLLNEQQEGIEVFAESKFELPYRDIKRWPPEEEAIWKMGLQ